MLVFFWIEDQQGNKHWINLSICYKSFEKRGHLNVDVRIHGFNFVKCIICESLKDLISKLEKNSDGAKEHEMKL